jgi:hypothetical protein
MNSKVIFWIYSFLEIVIRRNYRFGFTKLKSFGIPNKPLRPIQTLTKLGNKKIIKMRYVIWMIQTGRINLEERGILRWKLNLFHNKYKNYINKDKKVIIRSFWNILYKQLIKKTLKSLQAWKTTTIFYKGLEKTQLKSLKLLHSIVKAHLKRIITVFKLHPVRTRNLKNVFKYLNQISLILLRKYYKKWSSFEYYYEYIEDTILVSKTIKNTYTVHTKPCVKLEYFDTDSFDPTFRAVFRSLSHFVRRKLRLSVKAWSEYTEKERNHLESLSLFLSESDINYNQYKLPPNRLRTLKTVLIHFLNIQRKISNLPKIVLSKWSQVAHIKVLKMLKLKLLLLNNISNFQKKKMVFTKFRAF